jgi:hypothetical protein
MYAVEQFRSRDYPAHVEEVRLAARFLKASRYSRDLIIIFLDEGFFAYDWDNSGYDHVDPGAISTDSVREISETSRGSIQLVVLTQIVSPNMQEHYIRRIQFERTINNSPHLINAPTSVALMMFVP